MRGVRGDMANVRKTAAAILVLLLAEVLYTGVEVGSWPAESGERKLARFSIGLPFRSIEWTTADLDDVLYEGHPERDEWNAGVKVHPSLLVCDLLVAVLVALLLTMLAPAAALARLAQAAVLGLTISVVVSYLDGASSSIWPALVVFVGGLFLVAPIATCCSVRRARRPVAASVLLIFVMLTACSRAAMLVEGVTIESELTDWLRFLALLGVAAVVIAGECLIVRLLHRRVSAILAQRRDGVDNTQTDQSLSHLQLQHPPESGGKKLNRRCILALVVLLLATLYVGHHFVMVELLRPGAFSDRDAVHDLVLSEIMASAEPEADGLSIVSITGITESFEGGLQAAYRLRAVVNQGETYDITVTKSILIPWFQLKKEEVDAHTDALESR